MGDVRESDGAYPTVVIDTSPAGSGPYGERSISPDDDYFYVSNYLDDTVSVIRASDNTVMGTVDVGDGPHGGIAVSPDGALVYVGSYWDGSVAVIGY